MIELYEVLWQEGEEEKKKYVIASSEDDLQQWISNLDARYFRLATDPDIDISYLGPQVLTRDNTRGFWTES